MKFTFILIMLLTGLFTQLAQAETCTYSYDDDDVKVGWKAYKTKKKVGVPGTFKEVDVAGPEEGPSLEAILSQTAFSINLLTVSTGDAGRDETLTTHFFSPIKSAATAKGFIQDVTSKKFNLFLSLNGVNKKVPMTYSIVEDKLMASGTLDVLSFAMKKPLAQLAKACEGLHEGKTWSEVTLSLEVPFQKTCKE